VGRHADDGREPLLDGGDDGLRDRRLAKSPGVAKGRRMKTSMASQRVAGASPNSPDEYSLSAPSSAAAAAALSVASASRAARAARAAFVASSSSSSALDDDGESTRVTRRFARRGRRRRCGGRSQRAVPQIDGDREIVQRAAPTRTRASHSSALRKSG
jgi:hypothetical protein